MLDHKIFTNNNFEVLMALYDKRDKKGISKTTQLEIAEELHKSRPTIVQIFGKLIDAGYLKKVNNRKCCYQLTADALKVIEFFGTNTKK